jgi:ubiquinol-cytochrome c reductase cytochrome b subunit
MNNEIRNANDEVLNKEGIPFFPNHLLKEIIAALVIIGVLIALATFFPAPIEPKADPFTTPSHIKPEWYFLAMYQILKIVPNEKLSIIMQGVLIFLLILVPFLDRNQERKLSKRPWALRILITCVLVFLGLTIWGKIS